MRIPAIHVLATLLALAAPGSTQSLGLQGPAIGVVYSPSTPAIQRIQGIPGSAIFGDILLADLDSAFVSPDATAALVSRGAASYLVSALDTAEPQWSPVP